MEIKVDFTDEEREILIALEVKKSKADLKRYAELSIELQENKAERKIRIRHHIFMKVYCGCELAGLIAIAAAIYWNNLQ